jgi:hypothetical protein
MVANAAIVRDRTKEAGMKYWLLAALLMTGPAMACESESDCLPDSQCLKTSGSLYGMCAAARSPDGSDQLASSPGNRTWGNTCTFDVDCAPGTHCFKEGSAEGFCMIK